MNKVIIVGGSITGLSLARSFARHGCRIHLIRTHASNIAQHSRYLDGTSYIDYSADSEGNILTEHILHMRDWMGATVIPDNDYSAYMLSKHLPKLKHYRIIAPNFRAMRYCFDKRLTYNLAKRIGIPAPDSYYPKSLADIKSIKIHYPCIIKPRICFHFKKVFHKKAIKILDSSQLEDEFRTITGKNFDVCVSEIIEGPSNNNYVISFFTDGRRYYEHLSRKIREAPPLFGSASVLVSVPPNSEITRLTKKFIKATGYRGFAMIEFKLSNRKYYLLDINPRPILFYALFDRTGPDFTAIFLGKHIARRYKHNVYWISPLGDIFYYLLKGRQNHTSIRDFIKPYLKPNIIAVQDIKDPLPFIAYVKGSLR